MTDTIDLAEKFHKTVYANGDMDVFGATVSVQSFPRGVVLVTRMPTRTTPELVMGMPRPHAIELRDALTVLLAATGGDS